MDQYLLSAGAHAFGDGAHETTRSTLAAMETIDPSLFTPRYALDVGAGSGITSFAVLHRFGCPVLATDVSASAVETLSSNISANGLAAQVQALRADGFDHPAIAKAAPYDLIVMNILAEPLMRLAAEAYAHLADGGGADPRWYPDMAGSGDDRGLPRTRAGTDRAAGAWRLGGPNLAKAIIL
jgi:ribosomal protein L11 methyltransferase